MSKAVFDTRFFIEHYYAKDEATLQKTKETIRNTKQRYISTIVIHEIYRLTLQAEGRETAKLRTNLLEKDFKIIGVDAETAKTSAELRHKYKISMADSIIAATALNLKAPCVTDDPHITAIKEIKTKWI
ncbi:MAG: PIN domain-containing protein [Candidatus Bathyarchaeia archaeon]